MIAYFFSYSVSPSGKILERPHCHTYNGKVTFSGNEVWLYDKHDRPIRKRRVTLFDDSCAPPKLIREDYDLKKLRKFKYVALPSSFINASGDIEDAKGEVIMSGPKHA